MTFPKFRLQQTVNVDVIRPGDHVLMAGGDPMHVDAPTSEWLVDAVTFGREDVELACFPLGRTDGRRRVHRVPNGAAVIRLPGDSYAGAVQKLVELAGGQIGLRAALIPLDEWDLYIEGERVCAPAEPNLFTTVVADPADPVLEALWAQGNPVAVEPDPAASI